MPEPLTTLATIVATAKKLREVASKVKDAEVKGLIADLSLQLADLKMQLADMQEETIRLRNELAAKNEVVDYRSMLTLRGKVYFFTEPVENRPLGPYCPRCLDVDNKLVLVTELPSAFKVMGDYKCPNCEATY